MDVRLLGLPILPQGRRKGVSRRWRWVTGARRGPTDRQALSGSDHCRNIRATEGSRPMKRMPM